MAKIVVLATEKDEDAVEKALESAGLDFEIVEPTPANLLHIVIGMVGEGDEEEPKDEPKDEEPPAEEPAPEEPPADADIASDASAVPESIGSVKIDGETIKAYAGHGLTSTLHAPKFEAGARTVYAINESTFSFWPSNPAKPSQRIVVEYKNHRSSVEVEVAPAKGDEAYLVVGGDLESLFIIK